MTNLENIIKLLEEIHNGAGEVKELMGKICGLIATLENKYRRVMIEVLKMKND